MDSAVIATDLRSTLIHSVLNARLPDPPGSAPLRAAAQQFHLQLLADEGTVAKVQGILVCTPEFVCVTITAPSSLAETAGFIAVECWTFHFDAATRSEPHKGATSKKAMLLVRAFYAFLPLMPASRLKRRSRHTRLAVALGYTLTDHRPAAPAFPGPTSTHAFATLPSPFGNLSVTVQFLETVPSYLFAAKVQRVSLIADYTSPAITIPGGFQPPAFPMHCSDPPFAPTPPSQSSSVNSLSNSSPPYSLAPNFFRPRAHTGYSEGEPLFLPGMPSMSTRSSFGSIPQTPASAAVFPKPSSCGSKAFSTSFSNPATPSGGPPQPEDFSLYYAFRDDQGAPEAPVPDDVLDFAALCNDPPRLTIADADIPDEGPSSPVVRLERLMQLFHSPLPDDGSWILNVP